MASQSRGEKDHGVFLPSLLDHPPWGAPATTPRGRHGSPTERPTWQGTQAPDNSRVRGLSWEQALQPQSDLQAGSPRWHLDRDLKRTLSQTTLDILTPETERANACCSKPLGFGVLRGQKQVIRVKCKCKQF